MQGATSYRPSGNSWVLDKLGYTEEGIRYDKNGNILNLIRRANGNIVDNLVYSYTGNRLSSLREKAPGGVSGDVYVRGVSESGGYAYDANGNMVKDMRRGLELRYNSLNLLDGVNIRNGRSIRYLRLSDGRKLGIRFSDGSPGYDYSGNMTYKVTKGKIERESLDFGGGCIASTGSGSYEVRYWLRDHLGSVRAVRTASGRIVEENAYYPFGLRQRRQDYAVSCNRYRYNGKAQQTFGYLDYGFRMYDACLGRWHSSDPLSERDPGISGYAYVKNAPLRYRDILGLTYRGYGDVPPYKYRWTPDGYELEEVVVTAPRGGSGYAFPILGAMGYFGQSGALWRTVFTWERYFESASDLRSVYGNASPNTSYDAPGPHSLHPDSHIPSGGGALPWYSIYNWPILSSSAQTMDAIYVGDYLSAIGHFLTCAAEFITLGYSSEITASVRVSVGNLKIPIYRVFGGEARAIGNYWSPINPRLYGSQYRNLAGLPNSNTGAFTLKATTPLRNINPTTIKPTTPLDGNFGRLVPELKVFDKDIIMVKDFWVNF